MAEDAGGRYAVILTTDEGQEIISDIKLMDGTEPEINVDAIDRGYGLEKVADGVKIGMVRGGTVFAVDGWGFQDELSAAGRSDAGVTRLADTADKRDESALPAVSHEKQRGLASPTKTEAAAEPKPKPKPKPKPAPKKRAAAPRKASARKRKAA